MILYLIKPNGQFAGRVEGTTGEVLAQVPPDYNSTAVPPPRESDYWNGSSWVAIGPQPAYYMNFDYGLKKWVDSRNLTDVQKMKWDLVKVERNVAEYGGFEFDGHKYDSDLNSQCRILSALILNQDVEWTTATEDVVSLTAAQLQELGKAMAEHVQKVHAAGRVARKAIYSATTPAEVDAVTFFAG